jgi:hypothetical protein
MTGRTIRTIAVALLVTTVGSAGCGYLLYPERRGTKSGTIDSGTMVMDLLWLLPGIVPGVVALIVDFSSGAIYVQGRAALVPPRSTDQHLVVRLPRFSKPAGLPARLPARLDVRLVTSERRVLAHETLSVGSNKAEDQSVELILRRTEKNQPVFLEVERDDGASARLSTPL